SRESRSRASIVAVACGRTVRDARRMTRVAGVVLVRDEDAFVEQAVRNVADFCDELLLFDHRSREGTREILERLPDELPHARFEAIRDPGTSHERLLPFVGTD